MNLPEGFLNRMRESLKEAFPAFMERYNHPPVRGLRVNDAKISREEFLRITNFRVEPVPWEENGFYCEEEKLGAHPYHFAGLFYGQEPSAMLPVNLFEFHAGERVLDLCAAPGGKSGQIAQGLIRAGGGVLVTNEYESARARILAENIERLGFKNTAVTNAPPELLARKFPACFDKILVDAPCSGEGMFKKEPQAVSAWNEKSVTFCALRQREILRCAVSMLKAGGMLVYSTCTFSPEENEQNVEWLLNKFPTLELIETRKILPHENLGEGQFCALFKKTDGEEGRITSFALGRNNGAERAARGFCGEFLKCGLDGNISCLPDGRIFLVPQGLPALDGVRTLRAGVCLGEWDGKLFKPCHNLVTAFSKEVFNSYEALSHEESLKYLRGETLSCNARNGFVAVGIGDYPLGLGKAVNGTLKNHYPKGLRLRD